MPTWFALANAPGAPLDGVVFSERLTVFDLVVFDGRLLTCPVELAFRQAPALRMDNKKPPGFDGAKLTPQGIINATLDMKLHAWTNEQRDALETFLEAYWRKPTKDFRDKRSAKGTQPVYTISHPSLPPYGITHVIVTGVGGPMVEGGDKQHRSVTVALTQWIDVKKKAAPSKAKPGPDVKVDKGVKNNNLPANTGGKPPSKSFTTPKKRTA